MLTRKSRAFRPGTVANHEAHVRLFAAFAIHFQMRDFPAPVTSLLLFAEFLLRTYRAPKSVFNALSSLRTFHLLHGLPTEAFQDYQLALFKRALPLTVRHVPQGASPLPFQLLERLCAVASSQGTQGPAVAALLAACYFSMARLSSLAPPNKGPYDTSRYPTVADVTPTPNGLSLCIKWAKNRQLPGQHLSAPLLPLSTSPACPVRLLNTLRARREGAAPSAPLFVGGGPADTFISAPVARAWLGVLLTYLGLPQHAYTFHSLRRGACHLAFGQGASVTDIQALGGWRSQAVACYLPLDAARARAAASLSAATFPPQPLLGP